MYKDFQKELYNRETYETEQGFVMYNFYEDKSVYIHAVYVKPEFRQKGQVAKFIKDLLINQLGATVATGYVDLTTNNPELALSAWLAVGAKIVEASDKSIVLQKEIK